MRMTEHPRLQKVQDSPDDCYRRHYGAGVVEVAFRAAEWWLNTQTRLAQFNSYREHSIMRRTVATTRTARACQLASLLAVLCMVLGVLALEITRGTAHTRTGPEPMRVVVGR
jgi:hypothetical protein